jgi:hypothetical protein
VNGDLVQGVEPSSPPRNRGRRRSRGRNRRREDRTDAWRLPPRFVSQVRMGATPAHEGKANASLAARRALVPRQGESPADAKWPLPTEGALGRRSHCRSRGGGGSGLGSSRLGGLTRRRGHRPPKTGARDATGASEVSRIDHARKNTPHAVKESPERGGCGSPKRGTGHVMTSPPRPRGGSQNPPLPLRAQARGMHREPTSTGTRSREFGKQTSVGRTAECSGGDALQSAASSQVPSPKETVTLLGTNPDDGGRPREGENGAQVSRVVVKGFARRADSWVERPTEAHDTVSGALDPTPAVL